MDGQRVTRMGFVALGEVTEYGAGVVLPHERTHAGPKKERLEHLEATGAESGLIFMLVGDADGTLLRATMPDGEPIAEGRDLRGERQQVWRLTDASVVARIAWLMAPRPVIIADGHHRYETAVAAGAEDILVVLVSTEDPGLMIFPTHRIAERLNGAAATQDLEAALDDLQGRPPDRAAAVLYRKGGAALVEEKGAETRVRAPESESLGALAPWWFVGAAVLLALLLALNEGLLARLEGRR